MKKKLISFFILFSLMFLLPISIRAVTTSIRLYAKSESEAYVAGVKVTSMLSEDDKYLFYSLDRKAVKNVLIKPLAGENKDGGLVYILKNGYPNVSITGDKNKDYYITQTAIWWYRDLVNNSTNLDSKFKVGGADSYHIRYKIKDLANAGYSHRNDDVLDHELNFVLGSESHKMILKDHYYVSSDIKAAEKKNLNHYTITLKNAPKGTIIVYSSGVEEVYANEFTLAANDSFKIKVPLASLSGTKVSIQVCGMGEGNSHFVVKEYQPASSPSVSNMVISVNGFEHMASNMSLEIASSKVSISKIDASTKQPLAGAKLALKDSSGKVISTWTSTINAHVFHNLASGDYTIEEVEAPKGYEKNPTVTKFSIQGNLSDVKVVIENQVKKSVVTITKVDQATNQPLSGAVLLVKRSDGVEIARFTTKETAHTLMDLVDGTYTVEEISAPVGYMKSNEKITFQIDANHLSHQINFVNAKAVPVPDTASFSSILFFLLGSVIIGAAGVFVYRYGKRV